MSGFDLTNTKNVIEILEIIQKTANATYELLENLLAWANSQRNEIIFNPEIINLSKIINNIVLLFAESLSSKKITIKNNISESLSVYADKNMLMTVLRNLISNAIKFTYFEKNIYIDFEQNETENLIIIKDEGVGIKEENLSKLFKLTENVSTYGTANEKGSGLGLMLCKNFIDKHNGKIWVESVVNKGSEFKFTLPKQNL